MKAKTWTKMVIYIWILGVFLSALIVIAVDPYHHYHKPLKCFDYAVGDEAYTNDGKCRNFDYDALITGTSMTTGFSEKEASEIFDMTFIRATFLGEGFKRINENLETAIKHNPDLKLVIRSVDTLWFVTDVDWHGYDDYPTYLYNDDFFDDMQYLYNFDVWADAVIPTLKTFHISKENVENDTIDIKHKEYLEAERALDNYERPEKGNAILDEAETEQMYTDLNKNLEVNVLRVIEENPDIEFYLYFPPYSILWWDSIHQAGEGRVERRIDFEQYAIEKLLNYDNVKLFSFFNNFELVCDLDNYSDDIHYHPNVNSQILTWMKNGEYQLTKENYMVYISELKEFYVNYDYDAIFDE